MPGLRLDGAGTVKMTTLEECIGIHTRVHNLVEQYALAIKRNQPASHLLMNLKRQMPMLAGKLKGQFGMIADVAASLNLVATRGGSETVKIRMLREGVGSLRQQLEIAVVKIKENHAVIEEVVEGARKPGE